MARNGLTSNNFISEEERKNGSNCGIQSINKSFNKLTQLKDRNWSQRDINTQVYTSPSNFGTVYNATLNTKFNSLLMKKNERHVGLKDNMMSQKLRMTNEKSRLYYNDFKNEQLNSINLMLIKKKTQSP